MGNGRLAQRLKYDFWLLVGYVALLVTCYLLNFTSN